jgi:hypothetical protein
MEASLKDHKGPVSAIAARRGGGDEAVSASADGSCIVWDLAAHRWVGGGVGGEVVGEAAQLVVSRVGGFGCRLCRSSHNTHLSAAL